LGQSIGRLELIEPLRDVHLPSQSTQSFALTTARAFHSALTGLQDLKGSTKLTLATPQKVCRTKKTAFCPVTMHPLFRIMITNRSNYPVFNVELIIKPAFSLSVQLLLLVSKQAAIASRVAPIYQGRGSIPDSIQAADP
jgi:hypothetical protein